MSSPIAGDVGSREGSPRDTPRLYRLAARRRPARLGPVTSPLERAGLRPRVDKALAVFLTHQRARLLAIDGVLGEVADALDDFVLRGGKRLRPAFAYWGYRGAGGIDNDQIERAHV